MYSIGAFDYVFKGSGQKKIFSTNYFEINHGDFVLVTGPSGAGKSTLLQILKGIIPNYSSGDFSGEVLYRGTILSGENFSSNLSEILFLFQNPFSQLVYSAVPEEFFFTMENFSFSCNEMDQKKIQFLESFELKNIWNKKTHQLSNGECQKLVLSSLLAVEPKVLLLDEPTAFLDPWARENFYRWLSQIKGQYTIVMIDHHLSEVLPLVDYGIGVSLEGEIRRIEKKQIEFENKCKEKKPPLNLTQIFARSALEIRELNFSYPNQQALVQNISIELQSGKIAVIKGKNGAGKSTLFKLLAGFLEPKSGTIEFYENGKKLDRRKSLEHFAMIFQNPESHFFFDTIREELESIVSAFTYQGWLEYFFTSIDLDKSPHLLSEGEKRRLSFFLALLQNRNIILYDEPTFGLDFENKKLVIDTILSLKSLQAIQFIISHDEEFISGVADVVYVLEGGKLVIENEK